MAIQILQYEFLGPIPLSEWGPPMGKLLYLILYRDKDRFNLLYAGECEHTDDKGFFIQHDQFGCWAQKAGSDSALYLAVLPLSESEVLHRQSILKRIVSNYRPPCNPVDILEKKPSYNVRRTDHVTDPPDDNNTSDNKPTNDLDAVDNANSGRDSSTSTTDAHNTADDGDSGADTTTATDADVGTAAGRTMSCPCCGSEMLYEKSIGSGSALYRCKGCGMSNTQLE